jgi:tRNA1(Val) A37 N6-methylase TrmN6
MTRTANLILNFDSALNGFALPTRIPELKQQSHQSQLGQFMTPVAIANFMAQLFRGPLPDECRLLDAGAGRGELTAAFVRRWKHLGGKFLEAHAYEVDADLVTELQKRLETFPNEGPVETKLIAGDFIEHAATMLRFRRGPRYTHAILNPPYKKINSGSRHRALLRLAGLETVNLYSGFVGLAVELLEPGGKLVAIIPRSFCNGPYYKPFRAFIMSRAAIQHIHLFASRNKAFKRDEVLQENVIILMERGAQQRDVVLSTSTDDSFADYSERLYPFDEVVFPSDSESFIHIPTEELGNEFHDDSRFHFSLADISISVSTGPVVDFRLRDWLTQMPEPGTVPLLYPGHFTASRVEWPIPGAKKPNAIRRNFQTEKWLYPTGFYAVVRRFSSKEEKRRIVAGVFDPSLVPGDVVGFENHLNVFHQGRHPLPESLARGLAVYLNSTAVDKYFRRFNGHTQVNATDLKLMKYPDRQTLSDLGDWATHVGHMTQAIIDEKIRNLA